MKVSHDWKFFKNLIIFRMELNSSDKVNMFEAAKAFFPR